MFEYTHFRICTPVDHHNKIKKIKKTQTSITFNTSGLPSLNYYRDTSSCATRIGKWEKINSSLIGARLPSSSIKIDRVSIHHRHVDHQIECWVTNWNKHIVSTKIQTSFSFEICSPKNGICELYSLNDQ